MKLEDLHLGIFLSSEDLFYDHLDHTISGSPVPIANSVPNLNQASEPTSDSMNLSSSPSLSSPLQYSTPPSPTQLSAYQSQLLLTYQVPSSSKPSGPEWCIQCFELHARAVRLAELQATLALAQTLRGLRSVVWASWFGRQRQEMEGRKTKVWVSRAGSKIKVRRRCWEEKK